MADVSEIKLPSSASESSGDKVTCRLCKRQFAKYTCPTCNVPYCSLTCFRSPAHNQCSEGFYKKEIEHDIHAGPSKTAEERQRMMELLQKFEEAPAGKDQSLEDIEDGEEDGKEDDLVERLGAVDLDATSPDELWELLTPEERKKFMKAVNDPTSELARELLSSDQLDAEIIKPWWEAPTVDAALDDDQRRPKQCGSRPIIMPIRVSEIKPTPIGHPLGYNMCALCIAYSYVTRHLGTSPLAMISPGDPEFREARRLVSELAPFLIERHSTKLYPNLSAVVTDMWSIINIAHATGDLFSVLLRDAARLMRPFAITELSNDDSPTGNMISAAHPLTMPLLMLSDLYHLYEKSAVPGPAQSNTKNNHVTLKLWFYANHILSTPHQILWTLAGELEAEARRYEQQGSKDKKPQGNVRRLAGSKALFVEEVEAPDQS
ncbi:hypothetical protein D9619_006332 [Psilocybe cf. subviscida]|uniref:HIT-type domain-containing protein n=1 Tax=Psilocybe cf. subviscida TaxID=2480587 RepID=A0A8H5EX97_9AGAR|nr:hypothetical protein D9619_006332 [Psilocybe cf. subviscida]